MSDPAVSAVLCISLACGQAAILPPTRGCLMLNEAGVKVVSAAQLHNNDLCTPDGSPINYLSVWNTQAWHGKLVPPGNRVTLTPGPVPGPTTVSVRSPRAGYRVCIVP